MSVLKVTLRNAEIHTTNSEKVLGWTIDCSKCFRPVFKPSEIYDPLYKKLDFCSIIRYVYDSEKSDEAIFPFPRKHNYCAIFFTGFVGASTVCDVFHTCANIHTACFQAL